VNATSYLCSGIGFPLLKAAAKFYYNGSTVVINSSFNVGSITRFGAGGYIATFTSTLSATPIIVTGFHNMGSYDMFQYFSESTTSVSFQFWSNASPIDNANSMSFVIF